LRAGIGGFDFAAMQRTPLAERIDRIVAAVAAQFFGLTGLEEFDFLRLVIRAKDVRFLRCGGRDSGGIEDMAAGGAGDVFADPRKAIVLGLAQ